MDKKRSFAQKIEYDSALVYDLRANIDGEDCFFVVKIKPALHDAFKKAVDSNEIFKAEDFGELLYSGINEPSQEIKDELRFKYGMYEE